MSTSLTKSTTVLIVGAGPTGLATALSLLHHGFHDFVIVDAVQHGENTSRAIVVHAATLEVRLFLLILDLVSEPSVKGPGYHRVWTRCRVARNENNNIRYWDALERSTQPRRCVSQTIHSPSVHCRHSPELDGACPQDKAGWLRCLCPPTSTGSWNEA